jgi:hypothetical protein
MKQETKRNEMRRRWKKWGGRDVETRIDRKKYWPENEVGLKDSGKS